jgi:hypothetical protein
MSQLLALSISVIVSLFLSTSISVVMMKPLRGVLEPTMPRRSRHELLDVLHDRDALCHAATVYAAVRGYGDGR